MYHAEVLDKKGEFYTTNLRKAEQKNTFILNGDEDQIYEPVFTFQGFRYLKIEGIDKINIKDFKAIALYSDMEFTGQLTTSNKLINQLQQNIQWGQRGNFLMFLPIALKGMKDLVGPVMPKHFLTRLVLIWM